ncbi:MAG: GPW/gp25 family protein [Deltaproteobacteria bacterium]
MQKLPDPAYLAFPFRVDASGAETSSRAKHVKEQIELVLHTDPRERVFRPQFGAGVRHLVFEPNTSSVWRLAHKRLLASLIDALQGEVDPASLDVAVAPNASGDGMVLSVSYRLATIDRTERHHFLLDGGILG